jgi:CheY-like chemotaxis protein
MVATGSGVGGTMSSSKNTWEAFDEEAWPDEPATGVRTPLPPFDLVAFAKDSETRIRAFAEASRRPTGPPPAFHPSLSRPDEPAAAGAEALSTPIQTALRDCARRAELARAQLRVGGMSRQEATSAIRAELARVREECDAAKVDAISALASALEGAIVALGGEHDDPLYPTHVLVLDDDLAVRDRVTVAVEALGFRVRAADGVDALTELAAHATPHAVLVGGGASGSSKGWEVLSRMLPLEGVPLVVGGRVGGTGLEALVRAAGADDYVRFDLPICELIAELDAIFTALGVGILAAAN